MSDQSEPIAYTALQPVTPVHTSDGRPFGTVLIVEDVDVFDGIVNKTDEGIRFVDADHTGAMFDSHVETTLSSEEAADLPLPDQSPVYSADASDDTGESFSDRFGRMFGRGKWRRER